MKICNRCANTGKTRDNLPQCDKCGRKPVTRPDTVQLTVKPLEIPLIPEAYAKDYDSSEVRRDGGSRRTIETYLSTLDNLVKLVRDGGLPINNHFVYAPKGRGKRYFATTLIRYAKEQGHSTVPLLDTLQIQEFINATIDNEKAEELKQYYGNLNLNRILYADMLVVSTPRAFPNTPRFKLSKELLNKLESELDIPLYKSVESEIGTQNKYDYNPVFQVITYLLDVRKRLGKYTVIISDTKMPWIHDNEIQQVLYN